jgi:hypothetical protein
MAACRAAAEWAGWICKKDGRAQRAFRRLSYVVGMLTTRTGGVFWHASSAIDANVTPSCSRQGLSPAKREALFLGPRSRGGTGCSERLTHPANSINNR